MTIDPTASSRYANEHRGAPEAVARHRRWREFQRPAGQPPRTADVRPRRRCVHVGRRRKRVRRLRGRHGPDGPRPQPPSRARRRPQRAGDRPGLRRPERVRSGVRRAARRHGAVDREHPPGARRDRGGPARGADRTSRHGPHEGAPFRRALPRLARPAPGGLGPDPRALRTSSDRSRAVARGVRRRRHLRVERPRAGRAGARTASRSPP